MFIIDKEIILLIFTANYIKKQGLKYFTSSQASGKGIMQSLQSVESVESLQLMQSVQSLQLMQYFILIIKIIKILVLMILISGFIWLLISLAVKIDENLLAGAGEGGEPPGEGGEPPGEGGEPPGEGGEPPGEGGEPRPVARNYGNLIKILLILLLLILLVIVNDKVKIRAKILDIPIINFIIIMTRRKEKIMFNLMVGSKLEISFLYKQKQKGQKSLNFCYSFKKAEISGTKNLKGEDVALRGEDLALIFQINILERFLLPKQKTTNIYNAIKLSLKNENQQEVIHKHFLTPRLAGLAIPSEKSIEGTYFCRCENIDKKIYFYKIEGFSVPLEQNRADILMNELIPEEGTLLNISEEIDGITYLFALEYIGKTLKSNKKIISLIETIE